MKNIRLDLYFDGTNYHGWQTQPNAVSIEDVLKQALNNAGINYKSLTASGRTDSGVHSRGLVVNFFTDSTIPAEKMRFPINNYLPEDIRVRSSSEVSDSFHARKSAVGKHYAYRINLEDFDDPFLSRYSWNYPFTIDLERLEQAVKELEGEHDFKAYMASGSSIKNTVRTIYRIQPEIKDNILTLHFIGSGFLYKMVRILTGTLLQIASGNKELSTIKETFINPDRSISGITAPPQGLFLEEVFYDKESLNLKIQELKKSAKSV